MSNPTSNDPDEAFARNLKSKAINPQLMDSALLDCYGRFITLLPEELLEDHIHLYFQIQEAYWWYEDVWREKYLSELPKLNLKDFGHLISIDCPVLRGYVSPSKNGIFLKNWANYCKTIPLRGAILLNRNLTKCLMVQSWKGGSWMFPRGKIDEDEEDSMCASREVWEEIGVDISSYIDDRLFIEALIEEQHLKLFIIPGVDEATSFKPNKRKEIRDIKWIDIKSLSGYDENPPRESSSFPPLKIVPCLPPQPNSKFWQVSPFTECIKRWITVLCKCPIKQINLKPSQPSSRSASTNYQHTLSSNISDKILQRCQFAFSTEYNISLDSHLDSQIVNSKSSKTTKKVAPNFFSKAPSNDTKLPRAKSQTGNFSQLTSNLVEKAKLANSKILSKTTSNKPDILINSEQGSTLQRTDQSLIQNDSSEVRPARRRRLSFSNPLLVSPFGWGSKGKVNNKPKPDKTSEPKYTLSESRPASSLIKRNTPSHNHPDETGHSFNNKKGSFNPKDQHNHTTFGSSNANGWNVEDMFRMNEEKFGVLSTFDIENYTVPIPAHCNRSSRRKTIQGTHNRYKNDQSTDHSEALISSPKLNPGNNNELSHEEKGKFLLALLKNEHEHSTLHQANVDKEEGRDVIEKSHSTPTTFSKQARVSEHTNHYSHEIQSRLEKPKATIPCENLPTASRSSRSTYQNASSLSRTSSSSQKELQNNYLGTPFKSLDNTQSKKSASIIPMLVPTLSDPTTTTSTATSTAFREGIQKLTKDSESGLIENDKLHLKVSWQNIEQGMKEMQEMLKLKLDL